MRCLLSTVGAVVLVGLPLLGQSRLQTGTGGTQIIGSDLAVLEAGEARQDLRCRVKPEKDAFVGFDLRFHAGYDVTLPLEELEGNGNILTVLFRVSPLDQPNKVVYFNQRIKVPEISGDAKGEVLLQGGFDLGEGKYNVEWLMRDAGERVCSDSWQVQADLDRGEREIQPSLPAGAIEASPITDFMAEPVPAKITMGDQIRLKVLMNFAPQKALASALRPVDTSALTSILRMLARDTRISKLTVVAFNLNEQKVLYRQTSSDQIDFPALGESLSALNLGTVDVRQLADKTSGAKFLADLIEKEVAAGQTAAAETVDAVVFAGPKALLEENVPSAQLRPLAEDMPPLYYLNYAANPFTAPWRDTIGSAVKALRGTEYPISRPRDLWNAVSEMVAHVVKSRNVKATASVSSH